MRENSYRAYSYIPYDEEANPNPNSPFNCNPRNNDDVASCVGLFLCLLMLLLLVLSLSYAMSPYYYNSNEHSYYHHDSHPAPCYGCW